MYDVASRQVCSVRQARTNTPLQSLTILNDVTYIEAARSLAERVLSNAEIKPEERVERMFRMLTAHHPTAAELQVLTASLAQLQQQSAADTATADKLIRLGESKPNDKLPAAELAAYTSLATLLLNLDETLSKE